MNQIKVGGGAEPVVKAVLNSLGTMYIVETQTLETGDWYIRFSNGFVIQGGHSDGKTLITFPIEFSNTDFIFLSGSSTISGSSATFNNNTFRTAIGGNEYKTTTGFTYRISNKDWLALGFAA
ncbi:hypothetical protein [Parasutterella secunda]|uniref:hypothetical protein n=1 Tax=Parasutterella secunda TaxID=626947 RepID=UPI0025A4A9E1|nr:hypothetical protein [Parasutterella secunda]MDM8227773.1 hypothetical protein [Parasutterella secunda]